jgi:phospholipid transport system substrate-binding protein
MGKADKRIMSSSRGGEQRQLSRRAVVLGLGASIAAPSSALAAEHPSIAYMRSVGKDMLNAHRQGTVASFRRAIQRHADVAQIADYSLGQYRPKLPGRQKERYYSGVATFMARYFADQSRQYPVAKYEIGEATVTADKDVQVSSKVYLMTGQTYTVVWVLAWRGGRYKVTDVKVMGFSLVYLQRGIFTSFVSKRNGDVNQLVAALNR